MIDLKNDWFVWTFVGSLVVVPVVRFMLFGG